LTKEQILALTIAVGVVCILCTSVVVSGVYKSGGVENYLDGIFSAFAGSQIREAVK